MFFLRDLCDTSSVLRVIQFFMLLIDAIRIIVPVGLIVMISIDFAKSVIATGGEDMNKKVKIALKRLTIGLVVFIVPTIVAFVNNLVIDIVGEETTITYLKCLNNANSDYIAKMKAEEDYEREQELKEREEQNVGDMDSQDPYVDSNNLSGISLPEGDEYYPLDRKDINGEELDYLEVDGHFLSDAEMDEIDEFITSSVDKSNDWGTRVATAGWALAYSLSLKGVRLHYLKAGWAIDSRTNNTVDSSGECTPWGYCKNWGRLIPGNIGPISSTCSEYGYINHASNDCSPRKNYYYAGLDCTGFVRWAISTGCGVVTSGYDSVPNRTYNYDEAKPGDVLLKPGHVVLFLKKNEDGTYMTVESNSPGNSSGLYFHKYSAESLERNSFVVIRMTDRYNEICRYEPSMDATY